MGKYKNYHYRVGSQTRRSTSPKKLLIGFIVIAIVVSSIVLFSRGAGFMKTFTPNSVLSETATLSESSAINGVPDPLAEIALPLDGETAVGTLERGVIKTEQTNLSIPMASITKVITSLVILEKHPIALNEPGDDITLTTQDEQYYHDYIAMQGTVTPVTAGQTMTQYEALQAMLLPSSNNISDTIVDRYFTNRDDYLGFANSYLARVGLRNTRVADASGFSPKSVSTPSDLVELGRLALRNPVIKQIVSKASANLAVSGEVLNYNPLISEPDIIGIKPGATDEAGYCLLFAATFKDAAGKETTMIAATIGHNDRQTYIDSAMSILNQSRELLTD